MKARQIQARFWDDDFVQNATWQSRFVFIYLCTCLPINMSGIFQLTDKKIIFETGLSEEDFQIAKEELSENKKVLFYQGWVLVVNTFKNCKVWKSESNWDAWAEEWSKVSKEVRDHFNTDVGIDVYSNQKQEIENLKQEAGKKKHRTENKEDITDKKEEYGDTIKEPKEKVEKESDDSKMMTSEETGEMVDWAIKNVK